MKIELEGKKYEIGEPGPIEQDGIWFEFTEFRKIKLGDWHIEHGRLVLRDCETDDIEPETWIASKIPRASKEQLAEIGMREGNNGKPVECKVGDCIWLKDGPANQVEGCINIGHHRFVLVPEVREEKYYCCEGCAKKGTFNCTDSCFGEYSVEQMAFFRKNYAPTQPPASEPKFSVGERGR